MPYLFGHQLSRIEHNEQSKAISYLKYGESARDENGFPFYMTPRQAKCILRYSIGIFWRFYL